MKIVNTLFCTFCEKLVLHGFISHDRYMQQKFNSRSFEKSHLAYTSINFGKDIYFNDLTALLAAQCP